MRNSGTVFSAWGGERLVGLINVLDDGTMTAYVHYLLVDPQCQGRGVGAELVRMVKAKFAEYLRVVLVAYDAQTGFYEHMGFERGEDKTPMFITSLWT